MKVFEKTNERGCFMLQDESGQVTNKFHDHGILQKMADGYGLDRSQFAWSDAKVDLNEWLEIKVSIIPIVIA